MDLCRHKPCMYGTVQGIFLPVTERRVSSPPSVRVIGDSVSYLPDGLNKVWQNNYD